MPDHKAFISYSSRYDEWVAVLHRNLELCLKQKIFLDQIDLGSGRSWLGQLQAGNLVGWWRDS